MLVSHGYKIENIRTFNRTVIVNTIRAEGAVSKAKIARLTGISVPTVNRQFEELLREGLICQVKNNFDRGKGRPGELFEFNGKSHFVIGIDLAYPNIRGMIADLSGTIHTELTEPVEKGNGDENYRRLLSLIERLQNETDVERSKIYGIGLGIGGIVDHKNGIVLQSAMMGWENFPLAKLLFKETGFTLFLDNDVNLATIGEYGFGLGQGLSNLACERLGRVCCADWCLMENFTAVPIIIVEELTISSPLLIFHNRPTIPIWKHKGLWKGWCPLQIFYGKAVFSWKEMILEMQLPLKTQNKFTRQLGLENHGR